MNYFELYQLPTSFTPDMALVKKQFYVLSRQYHPDFFGGEDDAKKQEVLEMSAQVNKAYKTFQQPEELMKYVLQLKGLLEEEEKYNLPPAFLMEVMDLNEQVMELDKTDEEAKKQVEQSLNELQNSIYAPIEAIISNYAEGITTEEELLQVKEYYFKKKYLDRIRGELRP